MKKLASAGASVVVSGRTVDQGEKVAENIINSGGNAIFTRADVQNPEEVRNLIQTATDEFGGVDILINNAAFETDTTPDEVDLDTWNAMVETDFRAYWLAAKYAYPELVESDSAAIVNVGSNHAIATHPSKFPYNGIKAGIDGMTRSLAVSWGIDKIRVNSVNPGWTMVERISGELTDEQLAHLNRIHPLGRVGTPEEVADAVLFFASDLSRFVTGEWLVVDGGRTSVLQDDLYLDDIHNEMN